MSEYKEHYEDEGYKCPYCGYQYTCDDWGYDYEGDEIECYKCGKKFRGTAYHSVNFGSEPDCKLNGEEHTFTEKKTFKSGGMYSNCDVCYRLIFKSHHHEEWVKHFPWSKQ